MLLTYCLLITMHSLPVTLTAYRPEGYIGCFLDWPYRILRGKHRKSNTNSGDECIQYCKEDGYRYAGTESEDECFCGRKLQINRRSYKCNHACKGNPNEICGGHWKISVYNIWLTTTSLYTSQVTDRVTTTRETITKATRKSTTSTTTKSSRKIIIPSTCKETTAQIETSTKPRRRNESTQAIANTMFETTRYPHSEVKDDSSKTMYIYVLAAVGVVFFLSILLFGIFIIRRQKRKKNRTEQISHGTGSIPNIFGNILTPNQEPLGIVKEENLTDVARSEDVYENTVDTRLDKEKGRHSAKEMDETDRYNTLTKEPTHVDTHINLYNHKTDPVIDDTYSVCNRNQFSNGQIDANNTYSHLKYTAKQTNSNDDKGDNVYNILQLKTDQRLKTNEIVEEMSVYDTTNAASSVMVDDGDYYHIDGVELEHFNGGSDNIYNNDK